MAVRWLVAGSIGLYQRRLSPHKGFRCAHRRLNGGESCSAYGKRMVMQSGTWAAVAAMRQRFRECRSASQVIDARRDGADDQPKSRRRGEGAEDCVTDFCAGLACDVGCCWTLTDLLSGLGISGCG